MKRYIFEMEVKGTALAYVDAESEVEACLKVEKGLWESEKGSEETDWTLPAWGETIEHLIDSSEIPNEDNLSEGPTIIDPIHLWKFHWDCGRMGDVNGMFFATQKQIDEVIGEEVYFGEILGKHSEVYGRLEHSDLKKVELDQSAIKALRGAFDSDNISGYNPIQTYWDRKEEDE